MRSPIVLLALIAALLLASMGWASPPAGEPPPPPAPIAGTGGTSAEGAIESQDGAEDHEFASPADAPALSRSAELPPVPPGYNTFEAAEWITFAYPPSIRQQVEPLIAQSAAVRAELAEKLGAAVLGKVHVRVARTPGEMADLAPVGSPFPGYASGVAYSRIGLVLLTVHPPQPSATHDLPEVFRHELAHVALHDAVGGAAVPRWFNEGFAIHASGEGSITRLQTLWAATLSDDFQGLAQLERGFPSDPTRASVAYAQAADVVRYLLRTHDRERFAQLLGRMRSAPGNAAGQRFEAALRDAYGMDLPTLEMEWREDVARRYTFWPVLFSGGIVWAATIGLFVWAWRRRRRKSQETLARWAKEEALEDERLRLEELERQARVRIVLTRGEMLTPGAMRQSSPDIEVPKVEHDGSWHTLH